MSELGPQDFTRDLLRWSEALAAIARTGMGFTQNLYERERYEEVLHVAADIKAAADEALDVRRAVNHWKAQGLDISPILARPENPYHQTMHHSVTQDHGLADALDAQLILDCAKAIESGATFAGEYQIGNVNRTVGTMLGSSLTKKWGGAGLAEIGRAHV